MANFHWEKYVNNWEINFNGLTEEENESLRKKLGMGREFLGTYYKDGDEWCMRSSGMCFNLTETSYYPKLKEYLDNEFKKFIRKKKLEELEK